VVSNNVNEEGKRGVPVERGQRATTRASQHLQVRKEARRHQGHPARPVAGPDRSPDRSPYVRRTPRLRALTLSYARPVKVVDNA
jgi:hypothetical protein